MIPALLLLLAAAAGVHPDTMSAAVPVAAETLVPSPGAHGRTTAHAAAAHAPGAVAPAPGAHRRVAAPDDLDRRFAVEIRLGGAIGDVEGSHAHRDRRPGAAWRLAASYAIAPNASLYLGYGRAAFRCDDGFCRDASVSFAGAGPDAGVQMRFGPAWLRAGASLQTLDVRWTDHAGHARDQRSNAAPALDLAAGFAISLAPRIVLAPGLRYSAFSVTFPAETRADAVRHITADIGLRAALF